jgi:hypothetical protein
LNRIVRQGRISMLSSRRVRGVLLLAVCIVPTVAIYVVLVPRSVVAGDESRALRYLLVGWIPYTLACYAFGRYFSTPADLPNMRGADAGLGLVLVAFLLSLGLDTGGFPPERVPAAHVLQAIGIFVGLALLGWGIGRRSKAIDRLAGDD